MHLAYRDGGTDDLPRYAIGFGSQVPLVSPGNSITLAEAIRRVRKHVRLNDEWLSARVKVHMQQHEWNALSSLIYQRWLAAIGDAQWLADHHIVREPRAAILTKVNASDPSWVADFQRWADNSAGEWKLGLHRRRVREMAVAYDANYFEIDRYGVFEGNPPRFREWREFPAEADV